MKKRKKAKLVPCESQQSLTEKATLESNGDLLLASIGE